MGKRDVNGSMLTKSTKQKGRLGKVPELKDTRGNDSIEIDYFRFYESLYRKELNDWLDAREMLHDPFNQLTYPMQQLYKDAMLDNHLQGAIEGRILRVVNKEIVLKNSKGEIDRERSTQLQTKWMRHILRKAMESKFYGYSLMFVTELKSSKPNIIDMPRENVIPQKGRLVNNAYDPNAKHIEYAEFPNFLIYIQLDSTPVGVLERISPLTVFKRHSWANWDEFEQIFGLPIRIARTMINTKEHKDELQKWMEMMGTASYGIFDKQTDIEIKENSQTDAYRVFYEKIQIINKEMSKGIIGQTMTMDDGSSHSQATVHMEIYNDITDADIMDVQDWATEDFFPVLRAHGFDIPEGYVLRLNEKTEIKPAEKIKIDQVLMAAGYNPDKDYIEEFYGTPLDKDQPRSTSSAEPLSLTNQKLAEDIKDFFV